MIKQLPVDQTIPANIAELASTYNVGRPLKRHKSWYVYFGLIFFSLVITYSAYMLYSGIQERLWYTFIPAILFIFASLINLPSPYIAYRTQLYLCTEGLLKIYRGKVEAVRWDDVRELYTSQGDVLQLIRKDGTVFKLSSTLIKSSSKTTSALISQEVANSLLPQLLSAYEKGEAICFGDIEVSQKGFDRPEGRIYWDQIVDIAFSKGWLNLYYIPRMQDVSIASSYTDKHDVWKIYDGASLLHPSFPVLVALVEHILDQCNS